MTWGKNSGGAHPSRRQHTPRVSSQDMVHGGVQMGIRLSPTPVLGAGDFLLSDGCRLAHKNDSGPDSSSTSPTTSGEPQPTVTCAEFPPSHPAGLLRVRCNRAATASFRICCGWIVVGWLGCWAGLLWLWGPKMWFWIHQTEVMPLILVGASQSTHPVDLPLRSGPPKIPVLVGRIWFSGRPAGPGEVQPT